MCLRPDIVFVTTPAVYADYQRLGEQGLFGCTNGYHKHCDEAIAQAGDNAELANHWRDVKDLGHRADCSPLGGVEVDGVLHRLPGMPECPPEEIIRVYIGNPYNPAHEHQQPAITKARMAVFNARYLAEQSLSSLDQR